MVDLMTQETSSGFKPPSLRAHDVELVPPSPGNYPWLQRIETVGPPAPRWWHRGATPSAAQWANSMNDPLANFLVVPKDGDPIGRVFSYKPQYHDRHAYFAAVTFELTEPDPRMMLGIRIFLRYTFWYWDFEKLYMEVPEYNYGQFDSGEGRFFEVEGTLRQHYRMGGRTWDQLICAVYRDAPHVQDVLNGLDQPVARLKLDSGPIELDATLPVPKPRLDWHEFLEEVAAIAQVPTASIHDDTKLFQDLALDSLELMELVSALGIDGELDPQSWKGMTVRALYESR